jgi:hypothetical protein
MRGILADRREDSGRIAIAMRRMSFVFDDREESNARAARRFDIDQEKRGAARAAHKCHRRMKIRRYFPQNSGTFAAGRRSAPTSKDETRAYLSQCEAHARA